MNLTSDVLWSEFVPYINSLNPPIKLELSGAHHAHYAVKYVGKIGPISISQNEFNFVRDYIKTKRPLSCLELGTGCGISTLAIALGLKNTDSKLLTIDSYSEELLGKQPDKNFPINHEAAGKRFLDWALHQFDLEDTVYNVVEVFSNCEPVLEDYGSFDFVMIDSTKSSENFIETVKFILPHLHSNFSMIIHDTHTFDKRAEEYLRAEFGVSYKLIHEFGQEKQEFPLALLEVL